MSLSMETRQEFASKCSGKRLKLVVAKAIYSINSNHLFCIWLPLIKWPEVLSTGAAALLEIT